MDAFVGVVLGGWLETPFWGDGWNLLLGVVGDWEYYCFYSSTLYSLS